MHKLPEAIGMDDFKMLRTKLTTEGVPLFYCDKTLFIKDVIDEGTQVLLFTRPRRFGKTLNLSMLRYFFGTHDHLFEGLKISEYPNIMENYRDFPVVFVSFKDIGKLTFEGTKILFKQTIFDLYQKFLYLLDSNKLSVGIKSILIQYQSFDFDDSLISPSLRLLTDALYQHHRKQIIVLLDEYDSPLHAAYENDYLNEAIDLIRPLLGKLLKGNESLYKGVLTGISRVSKENIFSGLNNIKVYDIAENKFSNYFGFTENEIQEFIEPEDLEKVRSWYNGYTFGDNTIIYNPWSILHFQGSKKLEPYWINSSGNELIKQSLSADKMDAIQTLLEGRDIPLNYDPFIVLKDLKTNKNGFFNLLYTAGYLTSAGENRMKIPNKEIQYFFENSIKEWFGNGRGEPFLSEFLEDLIHGRIIDLENKLQDITMNIMSFRDVGEKTQESFYHGLLLGMTLGLKGRYTVQSNRESGYGLYDIALFPNNPNTDPGVIIEVKISKDVEAGLHQIQDKEYHHALISFGCTKIRTYGFTFNGKQATVTMA